MKLNIQHTTKKTIAYLILGLMCLLIINKAVFLHSHVLADGTVISHAHTNQPTIQSLFSRIIIPKQLFFFSTIFNCFLIRSHSD